MAAIARDTAESTSFERLIDQLSVHDKRLKFSRLRSAFALAEDTYGNTLHWTGVSLMEHTLGVLRELL